ncbi:MAG: DUF4264 family protein [Clostridiales bacterium]|jgi:hypothetical protein|nr:DUF4264 family protein [Clostridiales bacterium]
MQKGHSIKAVLKIKAFPDLYKIVDFLNKNLKDKGLIFGLSKKNNEIMCITIYEIEQQ